VLRRLLRATVLERAAVAAAALALCACPGNRRGPPPERFVPQDAAAVVVIPEAGRAARELAELHATIAGFPGAAELAGARGTLTAQLGFDPLDPESLEGAGFDPRRGLAVASLDRASRQGAAPVRGALVVLPVDDAPKIEALLVRLARDRLGATERGAEPRGEASVVTLRAPGAPAPALAYAIVQRSAILCTGPLSVALVGEAAGLAPAASLAESPGWRTARTALGGFAMAWWIPAGSPLLRGAWAVEDGLGLAISAARGRLAARAAVLLGQREGSFRALAATGAAAKLVARLDPAAQLAARYDGDPAALGKKLLWLLPARERSRLAARGIDVERDLLPLLAPGAAATFSLAPSLDVAGLTAEAVWADPLRAIEFEALLPVSDAAAAEAVSARLAGGARGPRRTAVAADGVHRVATPSGEIAWRVDPQERRIAVAGGRPGRLDDLLARAEGAGFRAPTETAAGALAGGLGGAVLVPGRVVEAVRAMPQRAFGSGPSGFVMRSLVDRILDPASRLAAASFRADLAEGALVLALEVEARTETSR
jgi:hypothetical protein